MGDNMDEKMTQEELDALLSSMSLDNNNQVGSEPLSPREIDAIGEIANICAGSSATNLSTVLNQRVNITTPEVLVLSVDELIEHTDEPCVVVKINYIDGIYGSNIQILRENDVRVITDLMMGGDGSNTSLLGDELTDLHMSALCEAMNQMTGASATSLYTMLDTKVDISPPQATTLDLRNKDSVSNLFCEMNDGACLVVHFRLEIGDLVNSSYIQIYSIDFAKSLYALFEEKTSEESQSKKQVASVDKQEVKGIQETQEVKVEGSIKEVISTPQDGNKGNNDAISEVMNDMNTFFYNEPSVEQLDMSIQPAQFNVFDSSIKRLNQQEQIGLIDDVSLEITVELGKTQKSIQEVLDFEEGSLIELNRLAGEMMDILVNGKVVAKGEIVVLEDKFAVQLKEIDMSAGKL